MPDAKVLTKIVGEKLAKCQNEFEGLKDAYSASDANADPDNFEELFAFLEQQTHGTARETPLNLLKSAIIKVLVDILWMKDYDKVRLEYVSPLCLYSQHKPAHVATLNWDNVFETTYRHVFPPFDLDEGLVLKRSSMPSPGRKYTPGFSQSGDRVKFLKLHGSADLKHGAEWNYENNSAEGFWLKSIGFDLTDADIVLGVGKEARIHSEPYLKFLLDKFSELLSECKKLHIVGYSFMDDHINQRILRRINEDKKPFEIIVASGTTVSIPTSMSKNASHARDGNVYASSYFLSLLKDLPVANHF